MGATPRDTTRPAAEAPLRRVGEFGDTLVYVLTGGAAKGSGRAVPRDGAVLAAYGARSTAVAAFADRDTVRIVLRASASRGDGPLSSPALLIGGWPRILRDGANVAARAPWDEGTLSSNAEARHPRSAIGYTRDRRTLLLITVDGRQKTSVGMTLVELAGLLKVEGAWDALNFDGGGSTTLIAGRGIVNTPSDSAGERAIGNALLILKRK
jgi:hypothetical protein